MAGAQTAAALLLFTLGSTVCTEMSKVTIAKHYLFESTLLVLHIMLFDAVDFME